MTVRDTDKGFKKIMREIKRTKPEFVMKVGIQGSDAAEDREGINQASLALIHEFGAPEAGIPERSFLRSTVDRNRNKYLKILKNAAADLSIGKGLKARLELLGVVIVADVVKTIDQSIGLVGLKDATVRRKGSSKPLIDTGTLKGSITSVVV